MIGPPPPPEPRPLEIPQNPWLLLASVNNWISALSCHTCSGMMAHTLHFSRNSFHIKKSLQASTVMRTLWLGHFSFSVKLMILMRNALPGGTALQTNDNEPITDWSSLRVNFFATHAWLIRRRNFTSLSLRPMAGWG